MRFIIIFFRIDDYDEIADFIISIINKAKDSSNESLEFIRKEVLELCKVVGGMNFFLYSLYLISIYNI